MSRPALQTLELRHSRQLAVVLIAAHLFAAVLLVMVPIAFWLQASGMALLLLSAARSVSHHALRRGSGSVVALRFIDRMQLRLRLRDGQWHDGCVLGSSTVGAALVVLNIRLGNRWRPLHVLIAGDSLDPESFRRLRVWLRWGPAADAEAVS